MKKKIVSKELQQYFQERAANASRAQKRKYSREDFQKWGRAGSRKLWKKKGRRKK